MPVIYFPKMLAIIIVTLSLFALLLVKEVKKAFLEKVSTGRET